VQKGNTNATAVAFHSV